MNIFFLGDFESNVGPAIANRLMREGLKGKINISYSDKRDKIGRVCEVIGKGFEADCICICSDSKVNYIAIVFGKLFRKKVFYIMHGYRSHEDQINLMDINGKILNEADRRKVLKQEEFMFRYTDKIFCVSEMCMNYMKLHEERYAEKFDFNYNGVDIDELMKLKEEGNTKVNKMQIMATGGGMRRKNNLVVCQAINRLRREKKIELKFIVVGSKWTDIEKICSYDFVEYHENIPREKVIILMKESFIFIQDSIFDTFNLSAIEALMCNCNLLLSDKVGAVGAIKTMEEGDIIYHVDDKDEIADKIEYLLENPNCIRLMSGISSVIDNKISGELLIEKMERYVKKR